MRKKVTNEKEAKEALEEITTNLSWLSSMQLYFVEDIRKYVKGLENAQKTLTRVVNEVKTMYEEALNKKE